MLRAIAQTGPLGGLYLYKLEKKGWLFWKTVGWVWAKTPTEALQIGHN